MHDACSNLAVQLQDTGSQLTPYYAPLASAPGHFPAHAFFLAFKLDGLKPLLILCA
jgi:hypothetical protein